ncbi:MAG TPA: EscU/YscU/HrcU family type III secretion system export apparatus switch protein [Opitutus sp.]|nr:EscU/YscU/HrcU family type III secretion system export apparatus switch protein [Opitutus sp.]
MADEHDKDQKTENPTEKRLQDAADRGQFAKTPEMSVLLTLGAAFGVMALTARTTAQNVADYAASRFTDFARIPVRADTVIPLFRSLLQTIGASLLPILLASAGAALLAGGFQSGFRLSPEAIGFKPENLDPVAGFQRIFSKSAAVRAGIDLLKLLAIGTALFLGVRTVVRDPIFYAPMEAAYLGRFLQGTTLIFLSRLLGALGLITAISYAYEKFKRHRDLMMTREEVKEERRNAEGDALVKSAQRRLARRLLQKQMLSSVPLADVIVTNPTHYAVALKYERGRDHAPVVLAKGENGFARRIKAIAAAHGVPMVENKPVARLLFGMGRVGEAIPSGLYQSVATILAFVYRVHRQYYHDLKLRRLAGAA